MDEIAPEYDVVVLGTGMLSFTPPLNASYANHLLFFLGLTECVLSGYVLCFIGFTSLHTY